jgi:phospholipase A-2-activating protein
MLIEKEGLLDVMLAISRSTVPNCMMILRTIAHLLIHNSSQQILMDYRETIFAAILAVVTESDPSFLKHSQWKHVEISVSTVILNYAVLIHLKPSFATVEAKASLMSAIGEILSKLQEEEALFRTLVAVGTLLSNADDSVAIAHSLELKSKIDYFQNISGKVGECSKQVLILLK